MSRRPIRDQDGSSLIELVVGGAISLIVLGAIISLQIRAYHFQHADDSRFRVQMEAANGLERIVQDVRSASQVILAGSDCTGELQLTVGTQAITYRREAATQVVTRSEGGQPPRTIAERVECLRFDQDGGTLSIEWRGAPAQGQTFTLTAKVSHRVTTN